MYIIKKYRIIIERFFNYTLSNSKDIILSLDINLQQMVRSNLLETIINYKEQTNKLLLNELYEDKLVGDILRLNGYKFINHVLWKSNGIELTKINSYKKFITDNCNHYISFYQIQ